MYKYKCSRPEYNALVSLNINQNFYPLVQGSLVPQVPDILQVVRCPRKALGKVIFFIVGTSSSSTCKKGSSHCISGWACPLAPRGLGRLRRGRCWLCRLFSAKCSKRSQQGGSDCQSSVCMFSNLGDTVLDHERMNTIELEKPLSRSQPRRYGTGCVRGYHRRCTRRPLATADNPCRYVHSRILGGYLQLRDPPCYEILNCFDIRCTKFIDSEPMTT